MAVKNAVLAQIGQFSADSSIGPKTLIDSTAQLASVAHPGYTALALNVTGGPPSHNTIFHTVESGLAVSQAAKWTFGWSKSGPAGDSRPSEECTIYLCQP